jgi:hypothetical protein
MFLTSLTCENYKAFRDPTTIEIKPITILIGKNSSGKSVLSRLPLLVGRALSVNATSPLELAFDELDFGSSTLDLIHNRVPHGAIKVGATFGSYNRTCSLSATIQHFDEYKLQQIANYTLTTDDWKVLSLDWVGKDPRSKGALFRFDKLKTTVAVEFRGLLPEKITTQGSVGVEVRRAISAAQELRVLMDGDAKEIAYLGPFRKVAERSYRYSPGVVSNVGTRGANAAAMLGHDYLRNGGLVQKGVGEWFREKLGGWYLDVVSSGDTFSLLMYRPQQPDAKINIADVGAGIAQVLPIVVQRHFDMHHKSGTNLEVVEQPELHLHQAAHGDVAELFLQTVKLSRKRFLIETHSEIFILRVRKWVAWGDLKPDDVRIYWVSEAPDGVATVKRIKLLDDGEVDYWPPGVFSEDFEEVKHIRKGQQEKRYAGKNRRYSAK